MNLEDLTTYPEIRVLLGVDDSELSDETLSLPRWDTVVTEAFNDISALAGPAYETISEKTPSLRTPNEERYYLVCRLYAAYVVAKDLLTSITMFALQREQDGKAEGQRFAFDEEVRKGVIRGEANILLKLKQLLAIIDPGYSPVATTPVFMTAVPLAVNPITSTT